MGDAHLVNFRDRRGLAAAKSELVLSLGSGGLAVLNGDDPLVRSMASLHRGNIFFFGTGSTAGLRLTGFSESFARDFIE